MRILMRILNLLLLSFINVKISLKIFLLIQYKHKLEEHKRKRTPEKRREKRKTFSEITSKLTERQFRCLFCLPRVFFYKLCTQIEISTGDHLFKSERKVRHQTKTQKRQLISVVEKFLENYKQLSIWE
mmetsp:Transcript_10140/g.11578  ORF Transcript_10140/g.11578 Transcript_10140/m.11578 type:complete len:128 (+) Transcript_10140:2-385(+)